jgi:hypothetical protein
VNVSGDGSWLQAQRMAAQVNAAFAGMLRNKKAAAVMRQRIALIHRNGELFPSFELQFGHWMISSGTRS